MLHGARLSLGSVSAIQRQVSHALATPVETAREFVRHQAVNHVDETSWRERSKLNWLWVNATGQVTTFRVALKRDAATAREVIGRAKTSIITTDRYLGYSWLATQRRQVCWAHLKRDFQAISERNGESQEIGEALLGETKEVFRLWHQVTDGTLSRRKFQQLLMPVEQRVKELLDEGSEYSGPQNLDSQRCYFKVDVNHHEKALYGGLQSQTRPRTFAGEQVTVAACRRA